MTNREWLRGLTDENLAMWLCNRFRTAELVDGSELHQIQLQETGVSNVVDECKGIACNVKHWLEEKHG